MFGLIVRAMFWTLAALLLVCGVALIAGGIWPGDTILARALPANFIVVENNLVAIDVMRRLHVRVTLPDDDTGLRLSPVGFSDASRHRVQMAMWRDGEPVFYTLDLRTRALSPAENVLPAFGAASPDSDRRRVAAPNGDLTAIYTPTTLRLIDTTADDLRYDIDDINDISRVTWAASGDYLLVMSGDVRSEARTVYTVAANGEVTALDVRSMLDFRLNVIHADWSPDGAYLMIYGHRAGASGRGVVFLADPDGESVWLLSDWVNWPPEWLPDEAATLLYSRGQPTTDKTLMRHHAPTGDKTAIYRGDIEGFRVTPDGGRVMLLEGVPVEQIRNLREKQLRLLNLSSGDVVTLYRDVYELYAPQYIPAD